MTTFMFKYRSAQKYYMQNYFSFFYTRRSVEIDKVRWMGKSNILKQVFIIQHVSYLAIVAITLVGGHLFPFGDNHALFYVFI